MRTFEVGGVTETVYERTDFPPAKLKETLAKETVAVLGYGPQGRAQALNLRDKGVKVFVCNRQDPNYEIAKQDGWVPGKTLLTDMAEGVRKATVVLYLLSDAGQKACWSQVGPNLQPGAALYFSHGFSIVYKDQTGVVPPPNVDVIMVAPKGSGTTVRRLYLQGRGINCSFAVHQDFTGRARERCLALGIGIGCGHLFETTFEKEVYSDLTGERGVLMGAVYGIFRAQYEVLRKRGHTPAEAFNETVEEATQSLYPLIGENGMDWMYSNCSATAQRGALDWHEKFAAATRPVFEELYQKVASGEETKRVLEVNGKPDYLDSLKKELQQVANDEMWVVGKIVRELRPENVAKMAQPAKKAAKPAKKAVVKKAAAKKAPAKKAPAKKTVKGKKK